MSPFGASKMQTLSGNTPIGVDNACTRQKIKHQFRAQATAGVNCT